MPKNEEFSRSVENAEIELDKNSNEMIGNNCLQTVTLVAKK